MLKWASACIPVLLQCVTGEGSACVIPQDVVSSNFHVGFWSWTSSYRKTAEKLSEHSEVVATPVVDALLVRGCRTADPGLVGGLDSCCNVGLCYGLHFSLILFNTLQIKKKRLSLCVIVRISLREIKVKLLSVIVR